MADKQDLDFSYTLIDRVFRFCFGETGDFSGAKYDGDFSLTLEEAQRRKHEYVAENLNLGPGSRILDMGCGWGAFLNHVRSIGAQGIGVTLSSGQLKACLKSGLDVHLMDLRTITPDTFGTFDAVSCIGAFEAFCSREQWQQGQQDQVYRDLFKTVSDLLPVGGRFFMQTMLFGRNMIDYDHVDINADKDSDAYACAMMEKQFPGHWLPYSVEQIINDAKPHLALVTQSNGRLDYIETQNQWRKKFRRFSFRKLLFYGSMIPAYLTNKAMRERILLTGEPANKICFEREILDHIRLVFEKT